MRVIGRSSMTKNAERREKFKKIGASLSKILTPLELAWRERRQDFEFVPTPIAVKDPKLSSRLCGPQFKTLQYIKTVRLTRKRGE